MDRPTTSGSELKRSRHRPWLKTTTAAAPCSSSGSSTRPTAGAMPKSRKKAPVTPRPSTVIGSPRPVNASSSFTDGMAAMASKDEYDRATRGRLDTRSRQTAGFGCGRSATRRPAVGVGIGQRFQDNCVGHAEDRGRPANPQRERQHGHDRQRGAPAERACRMAERRTVSMVSLSGRCSPRIRHRSRRPASIRELPYRMPDPLSARRTGAERTLAPPHEIGAGAGTGFGAIVPTAGPRIGRMTISGRHASRGGPNPHGSSADSPRFRAGGRASCTRTAKRSSMARCG